jgi:hypothetical protein
MSHIKTENRFLVKRLSVSEFRSNTRMEKVGQRVLQLRLATASPTTGAVPLPRTELARIIGMPTSALQTLEETPQNNTKYLARLAQFFGVRALWLETGEGPKYEPGRGGAATCEFPLDAAMLADAELTIGAAEHLAQRKFPVRERAAWLARVYEQLVQDGGKLTAEHQAAVFEDAKQGVIRGQGIGKDD